MVRPAGAALRRSTARRIARIEELLSAFATRDMGHAQAATLLRCSLSSARSYMFELIDAGVLVATDARWGGRVARPVYRLNADARAVADYTAALQAAAPAGGQADCAPPGWHAASYSAGRAAPGGAAVQRDPLVAALFGAGR